VLREFDEREVVEIDRNPADGYVESQAP
jgi:hypothetical protein